MKNDAKCEKELTCQFKIDMRNLTNFDQGTRESQLFFYQIIYTVAKQTHVYNKLI